MQSARDTRKAIIELKNENKRLHECIGEMASEIDLLHAALVVCEHHTHSMKVWNGQGWSYDPPEAGRIAKVARDALDKTDDCGLRCYAI